MKSMLSIRFDLPEPLGPTIEVKFLWNGPIFWVPAYDLKFFKIKWSIMRRGLFYFVNTKVRHKLLSCFLGMEISGLGFSRIGLERFDGLVLVSGWFYVFEGKLS